MVRRCCCVGWVTGGFAMEQLVEYIFSPSPNPAVLQQAQDELRTVQKSANGWSFAQELLNSPNPNAQFLGAQTFLVQLNLQEYLPPHEQIQKSLLQSLESCVSRNLMPFVIRKLLGVITKFYLATEWPECTLQVLQILADSKNTPDLCFEFLNFLIEDSELPAVQLRSKLVPSVCDLVKNLVERTGLGNVSAIHCVELWANAFFDQFREQMSQIVALMFERFQSGDEESTEALIACMDTLFTNHWREWKPSSVQDLDNVLFEMSKHTNQSEYVGESELGVALTRLVIAVCQEDFEQHSNLHTFLAGVASTVTPVVDDPLASEVLEFWNEYAEEIISSGMSSVGSSKLDPNLTAPTPQMMIVNVISGYWPRIKLYSSLRDSDWEEMASFRKDFTDFLELAYPILGLELFNHLASVVLDSLAAGDWMAIESALYCLNGLADIIGADYEGQTPEYASVQRIFQSSLWEQLPQCSNLRVKQTAVNTIGCFVDFFLSPEGQRYLAVTLNYLFSTLYTPFLQNTASRSIQKLCDTCRSQLTNEIPAFLAVYKQTRPQLSSVPHMRTVAAVACVIQAVSDSSSKMQYTCELFNLVVNMPGPDPNTPLVEFEQTKLKCVATLGRHLNAPGSEGKPSSNNMPSPTVGDAEIQNYLRPQLQELVTIFAPSPDLGIVEAVCEIFKVCFFDEIYSLSEEIIIWFICTRAKIGPSEFILPVMDLGKIFVASRLANLKRGIQPQLSPEGIHNLLQLSIESGQNAIASTIDMLTQIVLTLKSSNLPYEQLNPLLNMLLEALILPLSGISSNDRFVLRSAVSFWKEYLSAFPLTENVGVLFVKAILLQASGTASRSELGSVSELYKVIMSKQPLAGSQLLKKFVVDEPIGRNIPKQDDKTRKDFVSQLVLVKGGRKTSDIVQQFWMKCRGIPTSYDPKT